MNKLYDVGISLMALGTRIGSWRSPKMAQMLEGHKHTLDDIRGGLLSRGIQAYDLWIHAASLGEFEQARPIIEKVLDKEPNTNILLTFFSPSGYNVRKNFHPRVQTAYLPFDKPLNVKRFLDVANPKTAIFVKYEFWGNYLNELKLRNIPTYIVSAIFRPGQIFFRPWGGMFRKMLGCYTELFVQDEKSAHLLENVGVTNVTIAGDTRLDRVAAISEKASQSVEIEQFLANSTAQGPTIVFGSSWPADEDAYIPYLLKHKNLRAIIAPHEFDSKRVDQLLKRLEEAPSEGLSTPAEGGVEDLRERVSTPTEGGVEDLREWVSMPAEGGGEDLREGVSMPAESGVEAEVEDKMTKVSSNDFRVGAETLSNLRAGGVKNWRGRFVIVDCFGLLSSLYRYADIAYVGGGFGVGIHNINEAAAFSVPVVFGRNSHKFKEASDLCERGGAFRAESPKEVAQLLDKLVQDEACRQEAGRAAGEYIQSSKGATDTILKHIFPQ